MAIETAEEKVSIQGLYYRYKNTSDDDIRKYLKKIKIVKLENKGVGSVFGYYPLNKKSIDKISKKPRNVSLTFDATDTDDKPLKNLTEFKTVTYLVQSTSRFFLKPDIGEIFDQIEWRDLDDIKAICFNTDSETLDDTQGEHFLMTVTLLK